MASTAQHIAIRMMTRIGLRKKGYGLRDIEFAMSALDQDTVEAQIADLNLADALNQAEADAVSAEKKAAGGGILSQILAALMKFLESPQGQQLISALIQMLISMLGHAICLCHLPGPVGDDAREKVAELAELIYDASHLFGIGRK